MAADGTIKISTELDSSKAQGAMAKFSGKAKSALKGVAVAASAAGAAITAMAGYAIKVGSNFEEGMSKVSAISGAVGTDLEKLTEKAKEMGAKTKFSATEAASAFEYMAMAGWKTQDMLDGIEGVMNLAAASGESLASVSDIVTDALTAFGMSASESGHFADVLAKASSNSNTNVGMMGETFKYVAPVAGALGFSVDDCAVAIGLMANSGIKASQAGTALRQIFTRLVKPTKTMYGAMDKLGISLTDSAGNTKSLDTLMCELRNSFAGLTEAEKANYAATLAGQEGMSGFLAIVNASDADFNALKSAISNADGAAQDMAETMQNNLKGSVTILGSALEGFGIQVYERMQGPLKKAVDEGTEDVNRLARAFDSGGLKRTVAEAGKIFLEFADRVEDSSDSAKKIITPLRNIASTGINLGKSVLPPAAKAFKLLAENLKVAVPLMVSGAAAIKTYAVAKTAASVIKKLSTAYRASALALDLFITANGTSAVVTAASTGAVKLHQIAVGALSKQLPIATAAHAAFNAVVSAHPIGLAVTAVAALAAGLLAYKVIAGDAAEKTYKLSDSEEKLLDSCNNLTESLNDQRAAREEAVQSIDMEYDGYQSLLSELQAITDENGRVKVGYEERAKVITGELSDALGTEISLTDGVIQNYQETVAALDEVITKKKAAALLSSLEEEMAEAYKNSQDALVAYKDAMVVAKEKEDALAEAQEKLNDATDRWKNEKIISADAYSAMKDAEQAVKDATKAFNEASETVDSARTSLNELSAEVNNYDSLVEAMQSGTVAEIESAMNALVSGYQEYTAEMLASSQTARNEMISHAQETTGALSVVVSEGGQMYQAFGDKAADAAAKAVSEFQKLPGGIKTAVDMIGTDGAGAMVAALAQADFDGKLSEESQASYEAFLAGLANLPEGTRQALSDAVVGAMEGMEGFEQVSQKAEEEGISFLDALRAALDEHSPSKATEEIFQLAMEGAAQGVESGKESVLAKAGEFIVEFLGRFTESGVGATLQSVGANFMSFFGIGISSQKGSSMNAGQANASAAKTGAGSVDPSGVGRSFGTMLGTGVAGMAGTLAQKGKEIADKAKTGAGSVNPTDKGKNFGTQYNSGIGSKTGEANAKGRSLATNAKSGAGSVDSYSLGSNFGSGFVRGIGAWISSAARKAAELASSAYNAAKRWLDVHSPSKKTARLGKWFSQGFGVGIESGEKAVEDSAKYISQTALDALDMDAISEMMKDIDIPDVISRMNTAIDDHQSRIAEKVTGAAIAREKSQIVNGSSDHKHEFDYKRLGRELSKRPVVVSVQMNEREFIRATAKPMERQIEENKFLQEMLNGRR